MNSEISKKLSCLPETLAEIDGSHVKRDDLAFVISQHIPEKELSGFLAAPEEAIKAEAKQFSESEIERMLLIKCAEKAGYPAAEKDVEDDFDLWANSLTPEQKENFERELQEKHQVSFENYRSTMCKDERQQGRLAVSNWLKAKVYVNFNVSDDDIKTAYEQADPKQFTTPPQIKIAHIPFRINGDESKRPELKVKAESVRQRITDGASFDEMLLENPSSEGHLQRKGILDFFSPGTYNQTFEMAAFSLQPDAISEVIETEEGFEIIKMLEIKAGVLQPLEAVQDKIKEGLYGKLAAEAVKKITREAQKEHQISFHF
jgi:hypothetical protein